MNDFVSPRRHLVGTALRQYRENLGYTMNDAAEILACDLSKISRIETGHRGIRAKELRELLTAYGVREEQLDVLVTIGSTRRGIPPCWWQRYADVISGAYREYVITEDSASDVSVYGPQLVPELLQTREYALAAALADPSVPVGAEEAAAEATYARQQATLDGRQVNLRVVIGEAALHQQVGDARVMREQRRRLVEVGSDYSWVTIRVLPFTARASAMGGSGSVSMLHFAALPQLGMIHLSGPGGGVCLTSPNEVAVYIQAYMQTQLSALAPDASLALIQRLARDLYPVASCWPGSGRASGTPEARQTDRQRQPLATVNQQG